MLHRLGNMPATKHALRRIRYCMVVPLLCTYGSAALEYAIVLPVLLLLVMGIVEYSLVMYGSSVLQNAVTIAAREGSTFYAVSGETQLQTIQGILAARVGGLLNPSQLQINVTDYSDWGTALPPVICSNMPGPPPSPPPCVQNFGAPKDVVVYSVSYPWHVATPFLWSLLGADSNGTYEISASSIVQNEPSQVVP
jgi:Flp pilus assembly protein TadG